MSTKLKSPRTNPLPRKWQKPLLFAGLGIIVGLTLVCLILVSLTASYKGKIYPKTYIGTHNFGGLTIAQTKQRLQDISQAVPESIEVRVDNQIQTTFNLKAAGLTYDIDATSTSLYRTGRNRSLFISFKELINTLVWRNSHEAEFTLDDTKLNTVVTQVLDQTNTAAKDASVVLSDEGVPTLSPASIGHGLTKQALEITLRTGLGTFEPAINTTSQTLEPTIVDDQATYAVTQATTLLTRAPFTIAAEPAKTTIDDAKLFSWLTFELRPRTEIPELQPSPVLSPVIEKILPKAEAIDLSRILVARVDQARVKDFLTSFSASVNQDPLNAELTAKEGRVVVKSPHRDGKTLKLDESTAAIVAHIDAQDVQAPQPTVTLVTDIVKAEIQESTIETLGLKELIGRGETSFTGSPDNRVHNITVGASKLNGAIIPKDQEFSTLKRLGHVDGAAGYLPELVIKGDRTIPEFGGGLCQVSTTLFRSALNAGLPITARSNHSYRVSYYEPPVGLDATIFQNPDVDFKFKNDTPGYILVQSKVVGKKITFELYGTKDGRVSNLTDPVVTNITPPPPEIRTETDTLPKGEVKQIEKPHDGATASVVYTVTRDGQEIYKKTFRSRYVPWTARFLVGTKEG